VIPQAASLIGYGTAVAFGWLMHRQVDLLEAFARRWQAYLIAAIAATAVCLAIAGLTPAFVPMPATPQKFVYALSYSVGIWCWSFAVIGAATRYLSHYSASVRYAADASYWIYIVHLPVVAAMQVVVGHWALHWTIKFPLVVGVSLTILFASYRFLVRSTFIGQFLNGRRYPRRAAGPEVQASTSGGALLRSSQ
jgi:peptidoglycan/LPS O-acetylase OafA/YrhL